MTVPIIGAGSADLADQLAAWRTVLNANAARLDFLEDVPRAQLRQTVGQSIANGTFVPLTFTTEDYDSANGHSTSSNTSRYTATVAGRYELSGCVTWAANATGQRAAQWFKNGTVINASQVGYPASAATERQYPARTMTVFLNGTTDYVELAGYQDSGGALSTSVAFAWVQSIMVVKWIAET